MKLDELTPLANKIAELSGYYIQDMLEEGGKNPTVEILDVIVDRKTVELDFYIYCDLEVGRNKVRFQVSLDRKTLEFVD